MAVPLDEAGRYQRSVELNDLRTRSNERLHVGARSYSQNRVRPNGDGFGVGLVRVHGRHLPPAQHEVGRRIRSAACGEQRTADKSDHGNDKGNR